MPAIARILGSLMWVVPETVTTATPRPSERATQSPAWLASAVDPVELAAPLGAQKRRAERERRA